MKKLIIIRHSKSSWKDLSLSDFHRPLNNRGKNDAALMAEYLRKKYSEIDYLHSSSSVRTYETSKFFKNKIQFDKIKYDDSLYHSSARSILYMINNYSESFTSALIIAHNPGLTNLINDISKMYLDNLPTTGVVDLDFNCTKWSHISSSNINYCESIFPKQLK